MKECIPCDGRGYFREYGSLQRAMCWDCLGTGEEQGLGLHRAQRADQRDERDDSKAEGMEDE